jgi:isopenicillin N synthase-like dioxygenase
MATLARMLSALPIIDLSSFASGMPLPTPSARAVASTIDDALRDVGFLLVTGHGMDDDVRLALLEQMRTFFALPVEVKERIAIGRSTVHRGYVGIATETLEGALGASEDDAPGAAPAGDLKETIDSGTEHGPHHPEVLAGTPLHGPNQLPELPGFRAAWEAYRVAAVEVALRMQRGLALALDLPPDFFEDQPGETMYHLRMVHYPPMHRLAPEPGQLGCGAHTDYGTLTVVGDDGVGGLQVRRRSGEWIDVTVPPGHLLVNLGDLMSIWTNDRWVSNPHRVVNPPDGDRYSAVLFVTPPFHLRIEALPTCVSAEHPARHDPLVSGPYLLSRFDGTHSYRNALLEEHNRRTA